MSIWVLLIAGLSLMPGSSVPEVNLFEGVDKLVHLLMYAVLVTLAFFAFRRLTLVTVGSVLYGVLLECLQVAGNVHLGTGRTFELADIAANASGALFAACVVYYFFYT